MSMESHFEINVSTPKGGHLFATAPRSCTDIWKFAKVYDEIKKRFPEPEFQVSVTHWEGRGCRIEDQALADTLEYGRLRP